MCRSDAIPNLDWLMLSGNRISNLAVSLWLVLTDAVEAVSVIAAPAMITLHFWCLPKTVLRPGTSCAYWLWTLFEVLPIKLYAHLHAFWPCVMVCILVVKSCMLLMM